MLYLGQDNSARLISFPFLSFLIGIIYCNKSCKCIRDYLYSWFFDGAYD